MSISVYEYDGVPFERIDGKWICKGIAMRGPTGNMFNKEVPEVYAKPIEKAYQSLSNSDEKDIKIKLIGRRNEDSSEVEEVDLAEKKLEKLKAKVKAKEEKKRAFEDLGDFELSPKLDKAVTRKINQAEKDIQRRKENKVKPNMGGKFNPFNKV